MSKKNTSHIRSLPTAVAIILIAYTVASTLGVRAVANYPFVLTISNGLGIAHYNLHLLITFLCGIYLFNLKKKMLVRFKYAMLLCASSVFVLPLLTHSLPVNLLGDLSTNYSWGVNGVLGQYIGGRYEQYISSLGLLVWSCIAWFLVWRFGLHGYFYLIASKIELDKCSNLLSCKVKVKLNIPEQQSAQNIAARIKEFKIKPPKIFQEEIIQEVVDDYEVEEPEIPVFDSTYAPPENVLKPVYYQELANKMFSKNKEVANNPHKPHLLIGAGVDDNEPFTIPLIPEIGSPHIFIAGGTGSGKTTTTHLMLTSLFHGYPPLLINMFLIDDKGALNTKYSSMPHVVKHADSINGAVEVCSTVLGRLELKKKLANQNKDGADMDTINQKKWGVDSSKLIKFDILFIDEYESLTDIDNVLDSHGLGGKVSEMSSDDKKKRQRITQKVKYIRGAVERIISQGREYGVVVVAMSQSVTKGSIGNRMKAQTRKIVLYGLERDEKNTLGLTKKLDTLSKGEFYVSGTDSSNQYGRIVFFDKSKESSPITHRKILNGIRKKAVTR